jgi:signal transduction histidine kinase/DNA-binding NarL/FixJ family response regulator
VSARGMDLRLDSLQAPRLNGEQKTDMQSEGPAEIHLAGIGPIDLHAIPLVALLVEDNPADAGHISLVLQPGPRGAGLMLVRVIQRGNVASACAALRSLTVDVVLLDLTLPDSKGLEALHRVRAASPQTPVIVLSGVADQVLALEALRAGAQDYVLKPPPDGPTFARILRYACERNRLMQAIEVARVSAAVAGRQWKLLAEIAKVLAASTDPTQAIPLVANLIVPDVADCFVLFLAAGHEEMPTMVERWHVIGECAPALRDAVQNLLSTNRGSANDLLASPRSDDAATTAAWEEALLSVYGSVGLKSGCAVPLRFGERVRGLLVLGFVNGRRGSAADGEFTCSVGYRISMALEHDRLLRQAQRAVAGRDRALSTVSHDLRSPLNTIQICADALLDPEPAPPSGIRELGALIGKSVTWMRQIVEDLLDRASLDAGTLALHRQPTSVKDLFGASRALFAPMATERAIRLVLHEDADLPCVNADPHRLLQVLANLVGNAIKFTPEGGRVVVLAQAAEDDPIAALLTGKGGSAVRFTVSDTGSGIPAEDLAHIFERYWQSPTDSRKGAGLGLAIAKGLIEAHGRQLNVESIVGIGSSFWFTVPAIADVVQQFGSKVGLA